MERIYKALFLDIDGPINTSRNKLNHEPWLRSSRRVTLPSETLTNLKYIIDSTGAYIVLSSSWRKDYEAVKNLKRQMKNYELYIYDTTPVLKHAIRGLECKAWLENIYCISGIYPNYVILDDKITDIVPYHRGHCIQASEISGLTHHLANIAIDILNKPFNKKMVSSY